MPATVTKRKVKSTLQKANNKGLGLVIPRKKTVTTQKKEKIDNFKQLIVQCQKIGSELYNKGLLKPYDPIR
ncbi:3-phosphoshikimate 1-carboxyvinyltransferase [Capnocytophaga bilenii]